MGVNGSRSNPKDRRKQTGSTGEREAEQFLRSLGYQVTERNWRCRTGEIDLIAWHEGVRVFVEVRTRTGSCGSPMTSGQAYGTALESVDGRKQQKLRSTASVYLQATGGWDQPIRFDVIGITMDSNGSVLELKHVINAF
ncbi:YraN family protein [Paenibacillus turpanensis]|uniref:YraN family protein n=1 Tax=Paenibacillus turpanensis TaxID=2689078 RepID=UPI00140C1465